MKLRKIRENSSKIVLKKMFYRLVLIKSIDKLKFKLVIATCTLSKILKYVGLKKKIALILFKHTALKILYYYFLVPRYLYYIFK